ncbi:MAG: glycosyltransferase family 1 protein [Patescibacteria group bacterium]
MRIGIDCRKIYDIHLNKGAGVERYVYHLVKHLLTVGRNHEFILFVRADLSPETIHRLKGEHDRVKVVKQMTVVSQLPFIGNHFSFSRLLKKEKLDCAIFPANVLPFFYWRKSILVIHDLAIYNHKEWFPEKQWLATKILVPWSIRRASLIAAVSESTKSDLIKLFKVKEQKIQVIYPGVVVKESYTLEEVSAVLRKFDIKTDYALFLGTIEPRKNILNLIKAFSNYIFENEESRINLVIAGIKGWKFGGVFRELNEFNNRLTSSRIKYIGKISNRERNILIGNCQAFVFPSLYEGFGFPVLEAMALGAPVVTSNNSSLVEIATGASYLVDPYDVNDIRRGLKAVLEDKILRYQLIAAGKERVKDFDWNKTAAKFLELIEKTK